MKWVTQHHLAKKKHPAQKKLPPSWEWIHIWDHIMIVKLHPAKCIIVYANCYLKHWGIINKHVKGAGGQRELGWTHENRIPENAGHMRM